MKIILEGTETELKNVLLFFGIPNRVVVDDGNQFICGDMFGRSRRKKIVRTFENSMEKIKVTVKNFSAENNAPDKPKPFKANLSIDLDIMAENASKLNL